MTSQSAFGALSTAQEIKVHDMKNGSDTIYR